MATITEPRTRKREPENRFVLPRIGWDGYETMLSLVGDRPAVRITYDRGDLELMSPSSEHDRYKMLLDRLIFIVAEEFHLDCDAFGSTTWRKQDLDRGLEPDQCYYLASAPRVLGKTTIDLDIDPPPDLAVEIEISRSALDRMSIYAALGVPEVWRFDGDTLRIEHLQTDRTYVEVDRSPSLPMLPPLEVVRWLALAENLTQMTWARQFREWVQRTLVPGPH